MLITEEYRRFNEELHDINPEYGVKGEEQVPHVMDLYHISGAGNLLDYGCGKGRLKKSIQLSGFPEIARVTHEYDPAIPGKDMLPAPADLVVCSDVLEHVEPACLDEVLDDLLRLTKVAAYILVSTIEAEKELSDGRNTHLIVEPAKWWLPKIMDRFELLKFESADRGTFRCYLTP